MTRILAIDLGKFKSVICWLDLAKNDTEFWTMLPAKASKMRQLEVTWPKRFSVTDLKTGVSVPSHRAHPLPVDSRDGKSESLNQPDDANFEQFESEARAAKSQPTQYAARWLLNQRNVTSVVVSVKLVDQAKEVFDA